MSESKYKTMSPFSLSCKYTVNLCNTVKHNNIELSTQEQTALEIIESVGAVTSFQLEGLAWTKNTTRHKLNKLSNYGIINKYNLKGEYTLNVYTLNKLSNLDNILRTLAVAQLYTKILKLQQPCLVLKADKPLNTYIKFKEITFPVMVIRNNDNIKTLPIIIKSLNIDKLIIISEEFYPDYKFIDTQVRITTDRDLLEKPLTDAFYLPNGSRDKAIVFI